jgi:hypothetical protein
MLNSGDGKGGKGGIRETGGWIERRIDLGHRTAVTYRRRAAKDWPISRKRG